MHLQAIIGACIIGLCTITIRTEIRTSDAGLPPADAWSRAAALAEEHRSLWQPVFLSLDVDPQLCEAVIFPELMRYSTLQNGLETTAMYALYVEGGTARCNLSIGLFQMKPSFAEAVEKAWMQHPLRHHYALYFDLRNTKEVRRQRIKRLSDNQWQCVYLSIFVHLIQTREQVLNEVTTEELVALLATAYNVRFNAPTTELRNLQKRPLFHLDLLPSKKTVYYSYAHLAQHRYIELQQQSESSYKR